MTYSRIVEVTGSNKRNSISPTSTIVVILLFVLLVLLTSTAKATTNNEIECLAKNAAYEASGQGVTAMANVVEVTLNRVGQKTICEVVYERTSYGVCQFSWVCAANKRELTKSEKDLAWYIARSALYGGETYHSSFATEAQFFCVPRACAKWHDKSPNLVRVGYDGAHVYYKSIL